MEKIESKHNKDSLIFKESDETKNLINQRLENSLSLRKRKINEILSKKRGFDKFKQDGAKGYKIVKEELNIPYTIKNKKYDDIDHFLKDMKIFIQSNNIEENKYALFCIRNQTLINEGTFNKNIYADKLHKQNFIYDILNLIVKYFDDKSIIYEGIWILINMLYYQKDNYELILFLSTEQCIQLYIKILDKKDKQLRNNLYLLFSNLLNNSNYGLINQVLFHFYMSSLFKSHIINDLQDINSKLNEEEIRILINVLALLSDFISETFINLQENNIKNFIEYNSSVDYNSIKENNNYLLENSFLIFINYIENPNLTTFCLIGLSNLTNFLDNLTYKKLHDSGICLKLIKGQIKVEEGYLNKVVQIIGNFLTFTPGKLIDQNALEEILNYFVKLLQTYPNSQVLKRDIFWCASNIHEGENSSLLLVKSGLLVLTLQSICSDNENVINEALYLLLGFFYINNLEIIINNYHLDYIKNLVLCLKNIHSKCSAGETFKNKGIVEKVLSCIHSLFEIGNILKIENIENKFVKDFEKYGGFELLEIMLSENKLSEEFIGIAENILNQNNN